MSDLPNRGDIFRTWLYQKIVREVVLTTLLLCSVANAVLMVGLMIVGIYEGATALLTFIGLSPRPEEFPSVEAATMTLGLKSIEFILLAPLGYLFSSSLAILMVDLVERGGDSWMNGLHRVVGVKSLATSMLISIVGVDFVGKLSQGKHFDFGNSIIESLIFLILLAYLIVLEDSKPKKKDNDKNTL